MARKTVGTTKAVKAEEDTSLDAAADLHRILIDSVRDYAIITLDKEGLVQSWNPAAERFKGYTAREVLGKHFSMFYPPEDLQAGKPTRELEVATKDGRFEDEGWRIRKDGSRFWANVVLTALRDSKGHLLGFGKVTRDMTDRKRMEDQVRKQSQDIMEMATVPVVQVWEGIMLVPLIGMLDSERTQQLMERLLNRLTETNSPVAVLDITGVPTIDTQTAQHLVETIKAIRFVGADIILTGVRPNIAQTLVHLDIDFGDIVTRSSLASGLRVAFEMMNVRVQTSVEA